MVVLARHLLPACIVRTTLDKLEIELTLAARRRTLSRPPAEQLERSLFRLASAAGGKKGAPPLPTRLLDAADVPLAPTLRAIDAWADAATLEVGDDARFAVLFDPPEVHQLELPCEPLVGIPLLPRVACRCCEPGEVDMRWERRPVGSDAEWQTVARGTSYVPVEADAGLELRVTATPPRPPSLVAAATPLATDGEAVASSTTEDGPATPPCLERLCRSLELAPVAVPLPRPQLASRVAALDGAARARDTDGRFRVLSYNMLADAHRRRWDDPGDGIHLYCDPSLTVAARRMPRLLAELLAYDADVLCLQEVDRIWWDAFWRPQLQHAGYACTYALKGSKDSQEGVAVAARTSAFEIVEVRTLPLALSPPHVPPPLEPLLATAPRTAAGAAALPTVGQMVLLREAGGAGRSVLVAHTHLYFANPAVHVRLMQAAALLHAAAGWRAELAAAGAAEAPPLLFAGDLNSDATDAVLHLLLRGRVPPDHRDWLVGHLTWAPSAGLEAHAAARARQLAAGAAEAAEVAEAAEDVGTGGDLTSLEAAERLALTWHRLRKALRLLHETPEAKLAQLVTSTEADAARRALVVSEAASGKTLLDSAVLAMAEVEAQMRAEATEGGAGTRGESRRTWTWLRSAEGQQASLQRLARLEVALTALTTRGPAPVDDDDAAVEAERGPLPTVRLAASVGAELSLPGGPMASAYGVHTRPTHATPGYLNALDWIYFEPGRLRLVGVAPLPPTAELRRDTALPSAEYPSDHVSLACDLEWHSGEAGASPAAAAE